MVSKMRERFLWYPNLDISTNQNNNYYNKKEENECLQKTKIKCIESLKENKDELSEMTGKKQN